MFRWLSLVLLLFFSGHLRAQSTPETSGADFCRSLLAITDNAPSNFIDIRGKEPDNDGRYISLKGISGAITSGIVNDSGWRYEAVLYQGSSEEKAESSYRRYLLQLNDCLSLQGYVQARGESVPAQQRSVSFIAPGKPTVSIRTDHSENVGIYTTALFVSK